MTAANLLSGLIAVPGAAGAAADGLGLFGGQGEGGQDGVESAFTDALFAALAPVTAQAQPQPQVAAPKDRLRSDLTGGTQNDDPEQGFGEVLGSENGRGQRIANNILDIITAARTGEPGVKPGSVDVEGVRLANHTAGAADAQVVAALDDPVRCGTEAAPGKGSPQSVGSAEDQTLAAGAEAVDLDPSLLPFVRASNAGLSWSGLLDAVKQEQGLSASQDQTAAAGAARPASPLDRLIAEARISLIQGRRETAPETGAPDAPDAEAPAATEAEVAIATLIAGARRNDADAETPVRMNPGILAGLQGEIARQAQSANSRLAERADKAANDKPALAAGVVADDASLAAADLPFVGAASPEPDVVLATMIENDAALPDATESQIDADIAAPSAAGQTGGGRHILAQETMPLPTAETVNQLASRIIEQADPAKATRFNVELEPFGLGKVDVRVEISASGELTAALSFENPHAAHELRAKSSELQAALQQAGFDLSKTTLHFDSGAGSQFAGGGLWDQQQQQQQDRRPALGGRLFADMGDQNDLQSQPQARNTRAGGVDVMI